LSSRCARSNQDDTAEKKQLNPGLQKIPPKVCGELLVYLRTWPIFRRKNNQEIAKSAGIARIAKIEKPGNITSIQKVSFEMLTL